MDLACKCNEPPFSHFDYEIVKIGIDENYAYAEVSIKTCKKCGTKWVNYLIEQEQYTKAGRWWRAPVDVEHANGLTALNAKEYLESLEWCFTGGSFYDGLIHKKSKPITIL